MPFQIVRASSYPVSSGVRTSPWTGVRSDSMCSAGGVSISGVVSAVMGVSGGGRSRRVGDSSRLVRCHVLIDVEQVVGVEGGFQCGQPGVVLAVSGRFLAL